MVCYGNVVSHMVVVHVQLEEISGTRSRGDDDSIFEHAHSVPREGDLLDAIALRLGDRDEVSADVGYEEDVAKHDPIVELDVRDGVRVDSLAVTDRDVDSPVTVTLLIVRRGPRHMRGST